MVGDLIPIVAYESYSPIVPGFNRTSYSAKVAFGEFTSKHYVALTKSDECKIKELFGEVTFIDVENETAFITDELSENEISEKLLNLGVNPLSRIRFL